MRAAIRRNLILSESLSPLLPVIYARCCRSTYSFVEQLISTQSKFQTFLEQNMRLTQHVHIIVHNYSVLHPPPGMLRLVRAQRRLGDGSCSWRPVLVRFGRSGGHGQSATREEVLLPLWRRPGHGVRYVRSRTTLFQVFGAKDGLRPAFWPYDEVVFLSNVTCQIRKRRTIAKMWTAPIIMFTRPHNLISFALHDAGVLMRGV